MESGFFNCRLILLAGMLLFRAELVLAKEARPLIERLDERTRGKVILALAGLVMLGLLMMGLAWLAFRMVRRRIREAEQVAQRQRRKRPHDRDWARKPLADRSDRSP